MSEEHYLEINGNVYRDVEGGQPYYLKIPELHSVLFVTGHEENGDVKFHIVDLKSGHETVVNGGKVHFGNNIGAVRTPGQPYTDFVLKATTNEVILASQYPEARGIIVLNLSSKKVERIVREIVKPYEK